MDQESNPEQINVDGKTVKLQDYVQEHEQLKEQNSRLKSQQKKAVKRYRREEELKPFQAELLKVQQYLEENQRRMIILFEGRDAAGKGGTIRRVTRYMNEKHYRVVALGKPTEEQKTQWYYQKYVSQFPRAGEIVLFDRSWYNRAMVEPIFGFCTKEQYSTFMKTVTQFEDDLVAHDIIFHKIYFSVSKNEQAKRFKERETNQLKMWKLSEIDVQMQEKWDEFTAAAENLGTESAKLVGTGDGRARIQIALRDLIDRGETPKAIREADHAAMLCCTTGGAV